MKYKVRISNDLSDVEFTVFANDWDDIKRKVGILTRSFYLDELTDPRNWRVEYIEEVERLDTN